MIAGRVRANSANFLFVFDGFPAGGMRVPSCLLHQSGDTNGGISAPARRPRVDRPQASEEGLTSFQH